MGVHGFLSHTVNTAFHYKKQEKIRYLNNFNLIEQFKLMIMRKEGVTNLRGEKKNLKKSAKRQCDGYTPGHSIANYN